jgi:hypothetical protein
MPLSTLLFGAAAVLAAGAGSAAARPVPMRGVIEGFYGPPWSGEARRDVIRFIAGKGMNTFVYAPKNDPFHRVRWRDPYPADALADLARTAAVARRARVHFVYALSPALDVCYACDADFRALTAKLAQVATAGVRRFALLFDDAPMALDDPIDVARFGGRDAAALARAQAVLANRTARWLRRRGLGRLVLFVPTDYAGDACRPYHVELGRRLARGLPVGWTGGGVFAPTITAAEARARRRCLRHPVVLWDNYPANDTVLSINLHLGPLTGRDPELPRVLRGHLFNPMREAHASFVALGTAAAYLRNPHGYDPERAWRAVLAELGGPGFAVLAENTRSSALDLTDARPLAAAVDAVAGAFDSPGWAAAVAALAGEEARQAAAPAAIAAELGESPLAAEIAPWVTELAAHAARGAEAVALLRALKPTFGPVTVTYAEHTVTVAGRVLPPDPATAARLGPGFVAEANAVAARMAAPDVGGFVDCLGDLLGADIRFCTAFGLNVHGKALYFLIHAPDLSDVRIVTDRNVHDRLIQVTAAAYAAWAARRRPGDDALTLTIDGIPTPLAADGSFSLTFPRPEVGNNIRLLVATAGGDATALSVP